MLLSEKYPDVAAKSDLGHDIHLSENELKDFYTAAKSMYPSTEFTPKGCIECVNEMVRLVLSKEGEQTIKEAKIKYTGIENEKK
jgi:hypothetical protein